VVRIAPFSSRNLLVALLIAVPFPTALAAADGDDGPLDELVVRGLRTRLSELRREVVELEERFYSRYNELNEIDDFDVHCGEEAPTGTLIVKRACEPVYASNAIRQEAVGGLQARQFIQEQFTNGSKNPISMGGPPVQAVTAIEIRRADFQANLKRVVTRDRALAELLRQRTEALQRYDAVRRQLWRGERADPTP
jgi:hypothetical protein